MGIPKSLGKRAFSDRLLEKVLSGKSYISPYMVDDFADDVINMYRTEKSTPQGGIELNDRKSGVRH